MSERTTIDGKAATRRHIILYDEDHEFLKNLYGEYPGYSTAIRRIIHTYVERIKTKAMEKAQAGAINTAHIDETILANLPELEQ